MRGGPLTEPLPQRGLSLAERQNPYEKLRGPSLLTRDRFGAKKSEWERFKSCASPADTSAMAAARHHSESGTAGGAGGGGGGEQKAQSRQWLLVAQLAATSFLEHSPLHRPKDGATSEENIAFSSSTTSRTR